MFNGQVFKQDGQEYVTRVRYANEYIYGQDNQRVRHESVAYTDWWNADHDRKTVYSITEFRAWCIKLAEKAQDRSYVINPDGSVTFGKYGPKWTI